MTRAKEKTYWPHMIVGFIFMAIILGYWTVKAASSMPVQESNVLMQKYQMVDININEIMAKKAAFNQHFTIELMDTKSIINKDNKYSKRKQFEYVELQQGKNSFRFSIQSKHALQLQDAKVVFLLTRPHTRKDDQLREAVAYNQGNIEVKDIEITQKGRYVLQLRIDTPQGYIGYFEKDAYLN